MYMDMSTYNMYEYVDLMNASKRGLKLTTAMAKTGPIKAQMSPFSKPSQQLQRSGASGIIIVYPTSNEKSVPQSGEETIILQT